MDNNTSPPRKLKGILKAPTTAKVLSRTISKTGEIGDNELHHNIDDEDDVGDTSNPTICNMQLYTTIIPVTVLVLVACVLFSSAFILIKESILQEKVPLVWKPCAENLLGTEKVIPAPSLNDIQLYLNRTLIAPPKFIVSAKILHNYFDYKDILVFTGIRKDRLDKLVRGRLIIGSSDELFTEEGLATRLIILERWDHLPTIWNMTMQPVHVLHYENMSLVWKQSRGNMDIIQRFTEETETQEINEDAFLENVIAQSINESNGFDNPPIFIVSDGLSMESVSLLLDQIGVRLSQILVNRHVLFLGLSNLLVKIEGLNPPNKEALIERILKNGLDMEEKQINTSPSNNKGALMRTDIKGNPPNYPETINLIQMLLKFNSSGEFKSIRFWEMRSTHHLTLCEWLELKLNIFPYKLKPLRKDGQVEFLTRFWSRGDALDGRKLNTFVNNILNVSESDHDMIVKLYLAGDFSYLTLQTILIAEIYEKEANDFAKAQKCNPTFPQNIGKIHSIANLVGIWVDKKISKYIRTGLNYWKLERRQILNMHIRLSLDLFFPEHFEKLKESLGPVEVGTVLEVGILGNNIEGSPQFMFPTVAEYFLAWFVVEELMVKGNLRRVDIADFFVAVLKYFRKLPDFNNFEYIYPPVKDFRFVPIFGYLINEMLPDLPVPTYLNEYPNNVISFETFAYTCATHDLVEIFKFFNGKSGLGENHSSFFDSKLLLLTAASSSMELTNLTLINFEKQYNFDIELQIELLSEAVKNGKFSTAKFLIQERGLGAIIEKLNGRTRLLLHDCLRHSKDNPERLIKEKIKVAEMLIGLNEKLLEQRDQTGNTPLLTEDAHGLLLLELVRLGANVFARDTAKNTVLHLHDRRRNLSPDEYHAFIMTIPEARLVKLVQLKGYGGRTPLMTLIQELDPVGETLEGFKELGADFNVVDEEGRQLLELAMLKGRNELTLRKLIECGSDPSWVTRGKGQSLLHVMAEMGMEKAAKLLVDEEGLDVNSEDEEGLSPLDYVIRSSPEEGYVTGLVLLERGGRKYKAIMNSEGQSLLHLAAKNGHLETVQLLLHMKEDPNEVDMGGNTPLHLGLEFGSNKSHFSIVKLLLDHGANLDARNNEGESPLSIAIKNIGLDFETFKMLNSKIDIMWTPELIKLAKEYFCREDRDARFTAFTGPCTMID